MQTSTGPFTGVTNFRLVFECTCLACDRRDCPARVGECAPTIHCQSPGPRWPVSLARCSVDFFLLCFHRYQSQQMRPLWSYDSKSQARCRVAVGVGRLSSQGHSTGSVKNVRSEWLHRACTGACVVLLGLARAGAQWRTARRMVLVTRNGGDLGLRPARCTVHQAGTAPVNTSSQNHVTSLVYVLLVCATVSLFSVVRVPGQQPAGALEK